MARKLRMTPHGCLWLIERWEWLRDAASNEGGWSEADQALAAKLRGIPLLYRSGPVPPDQQAATADREQATLQAQRTKLAPCDAFDRESARLGLSNEASPELRRVILYEAALQRRLQWCLDPSGKRVPPIPKLAPAPTPSPEPKRASGPAPVPSAESSRRDAFDQRNWDSAGRFPAGFPAEMGSVVPVSMIPSGVRARVG